MSFMRKAATAFAIVAPFVLVAPTTAYAAATDVVVVEGQGGIDPGLPLTGESSDFSHVTFSFNAVAAGTEAGVYLGCTFDGHSDIKETLNNGHGSGTLIAGASCNVSGDVTYTRTGPLVQVTGTVTLGTTGATGSIAASALLFVPTSGGTSNTTSYIVAGAVVIA
jgi:hypothetical protein